MKARVAETAVVYPGTVLGEDVVIGDNAVVGKHPSLGARSTAKVEELPPLVVGDGSRRPGLRGRLRRQPPGSGVICRRQACVRERCELGDGVVVGRGSLVETDNDGRRAHAHQPTPTSTAYTTLEEDVFIAPAYVNLNDNFMGRTEEPWRA